MIVDLQREGNSLQEQTVCKLSVSGEWSRPQSESDRQVPDLRETYAQSAHFYGN